MDERVAWVPFPPYMPREETENIRLGAIIANPFRPNEVLTTVDNSTLNGFYPPVQEKLQLNRVFVWFADVATPSFWRSCWEHFSSGMSMLSFNKETYTRFNLQASVLVTKEFPNDLKQTEIMTRLENPTVDQYMNAPTRPPLGLWSRENPVYMITGLKFAKGNVVFRNTKVEVNEIRFRHGIANPLTWTGSDQRGSTVHQWEKDEETIVAYKLLKIEKNHQRKTDSDDELILTEVTVQGSECLC
ncbi:hypothetical protein ACHAO4_006306 [Trichoderma viride]